MTAEQGQGPAELTEETGLTVRVDGPSMAVQLWGSDDPVLMTQRMGEIANAMNAIVVERNLFTTIGGRKHVNIEGWSLVGSMVGAFPHTESVEVMETGHLDEEKIEKTRRDGGTYWKTLSAVDGVIAYVAAVSLMTADGRTVGRGSAMCSRREEKWRDRDDNQLASMAQTRAAAKAYRLTFGYVMPMAGGDYSATPAEEMEGIRPEPRASGTNGGSGSRPAPGGASNVAAPKRPITNLGGLLQYAAYAYGKQPPDVAAAFNLGVIGEIAKMVTDEHGGDWEKVVDVIDLGWSEPAAAEDTEDGEAEPATPEPAVEPETAAEAEGERPDYLAQAAVASAVGDEISVRAAAAREAGGGDGRGAE